MRTMCVECPHRNEVSGEEITIFPDYPKGEVHPCHMAHPLECVGHRQQQDRLNVVQQEDYSVVRKLYGHFGSAKR